MSSVDPSAALTGPCCFQGAVQGPEEFAEGFVIGVRSLVGHTVGRKLLHLQPDGPEPGPAIVDQAQIDNPGF